MSSNHVKTDADADADTYASSVKDINVSVNQNGRNLLNRADEVEDLLNAVQSLIIPFIRSADEDANVKHTVQLLDFNLPNHGKGKDGLLSTVEQVLKYSINTWDQGFLDKLYSSTNAVGVISELILAVLNTNLHVFHVSPALTVIEKTTARAFANLFGFNGPHAGGISTPKVVQPPTQPPSSSLATISSPKQERPEMDRMNSFSSPPPMATTP
ncbi:hypothetical protein DID88_000619 [Monilinia fructigena]|uniref:Uncharacterized protein n=1 Tax=Monilinia fructigena TaxID=38457 RepID=A0A395IKU2_9HELO|nr:hypothetical protein DID88_000619 [Monilinia fructigena]